MSRSSDHFPSQSSHCWPVPSRYPGRDFSLRKKGDRVPEWRGIAHPCGQQEKVEGHGRGQDAVEDGLQCLNCH